MVKENSKKCSNCGHNGHNSRSCSTVKKNKEICVKLFGFKIHVPDKQQHEQQQQQQQLPLSTSSSFSDLVLRKSKSTPNLNACDYKDDNDDDDDRHHNDHVDDQGYLSDHIPRSCDKKKGVPWTETEHLSFLNGLEKLGKGDWKGISRNYVHTRTATQVASHAQKYFKRLNLSDKRNRRFSLFDMALNEPEIKNIPPPDPPDTTNEETAKLFVQADNLPAFNLNLNSDAEVQESTFAKANATPLTAPPVFPYPYQLPDFSQMPYIPMMGMGLPSHGQLFSGEKSSAAMPSVLPQFQMMYIPHPAYYYAPPSCPGSQSSGTFFMPTATNGSSSPMARQ